MIARNVRPLSTLLFDDTTGKHLIRLSVWVDPEDVEILDGQQDDDSPTLAVTAQRGRRTLFGKIEREAYKVWMTQDPPPLKDVVPVPNDGGRVTFNERMYQ